MVHSWVELVIISPAYIALIRDHTQGVHKSTAKCVLYRNHHITDTIHLYSLVIPSNALTDIEIAQCCAVGDFIMM